MQTLLDELPNFVYGTTRLCDESLSFEDRVEIAGYAIGECDWVHTSHTYGDALKVLNAAARKVGKSAKCIVKIGWDSVNQVREVVKENSEGLGVRKIEIGQLCLGSSLAADFETGKCNDSLNALKNEGLVGSFVLETWPWTSAVPLAALKRGRPFELIEGFIFYFNPLQRFVSNELWKTIQEVEIPFVAMRTTCGGSLNRLLDSEKAPEYLRQRAKEVQPIYAESGCRSWTEFCARFALGAKGVAATVGATAKKANLDLLKQEAERPSPLSPDVQKQIYALQEKWYDEHDRHAEPWSM